MTARIDWEAVLGFIRNGATIEEAAARVGVTGRTVYRRIKADALVADLVAEARAAQPARMPQHGTAGIYSHGCRCGDCREAHRLAKSRRKAERRHEPIPASVQHGKATTYNNWSCRCDDCTAAHSDMCRRYALRRKERASS